MDSIYSLWFWRWIENSAHVSSLFHPDKSVPWTSIYEKNNNSP